VPLQPLEHRLQRRLAVERVPLQRAQQVGAAQDAGGLRLLAAAVWGGRAATAAAAGDEGPPQLPCELVQLGQELLCFVSGWVGALEGYVGSGGVSVLGAVWTVDNCVPS